MTYSSSIYSSSIYVNNRQQIYLYLPNKTLRAASDLPNRWSARLLPPAAGISWIEVYPCVDGAKEDTMRKTRRLLLAIKLLRIPSSMRQSIKNLTTKIHNNRIYIRMVNPDASDTASVVKKP